MLIKYRADIDGLRAVSILIVVLFHYFPTLLPGGFIGVDIFFVISGYLITSISLKNLNKDGFSIVTFYQKRILRILPALCLVLVSLIIFSWFYFFSFEFRLLSKYLISSTLFSTNLMIYRDIGYFDQAANLKPLLHLWSLSIEEQFYLFFPILVLLFHRIGKTKLLYFLFLLTSVSFLTCFWITERNESMAFLFPFFRVWELLLGCILAFLDYNKYNSWLSQNRNDILCFLALLSILTTSILLSGDLKYPSWYAIIPTLAAAFIISTNASSAIINTLLANPFMTYIGKISYPLYLWHWVIYSSAYTIENDELYLWYKISLIFLSVILSIITYHFVEKKIRYSHQPHVASSLLLCCFFLIGAFSVGTYLNNGFPSRAIELNFTSSKAATDRHVELQDSCLTSLNLSSTSLEYCASHISNKAKKTILIIGDSHAETTYAGLTNHPAFKKANITLLGRSGCPLLLGASYGDSNKNISLCAQATKDTYKSISNLISKIDAVIIVNRTSYYLNDTNPIFFDGSSTFTYHATLAVTHNTQERNYLLALIKTTSFFKKFGKDVYYLLENPELDYSPLTCLNRPLKIKPVNKCNIPIAHYTGKKQQVLRLASSLKELKVIDPSYLLCNDKNCSAIIDNKLIYADKNHLNKRGSKLIAQAILKQSDDLASIS